MCNVCAAMLRFINAENLVDDMTKRNIPYEEMREARRELASARAEVNKYLVYDDAQPAGRYWSVRNDKNT